MKALRKIGATAMAVFLPIQQMVEGWPCEAGTFGLVGGGVFCLLLTATWGALALIIE